MLRFPNIAGASLAAAACLAGGHATAAPNSDAAARLDRVFADWKVGSTPGCVVGVEPRGQTPIVRAYGDADLEHGVAMSRDTVLEAGSSSKQFAAAAILRLVEQGKLSLADDVRKHLPELPDYGRIVTIDNLLHHTSGLRDWGEIEVFAGWPRTTRVYTQADVLQVAARQKQLNFAPGDEFSYSNTGYTLLAIVAERVSGQSLQVFSREQFFAPLGMTHTRWRDDFQEVVRGRAVAYSRAEHGYSQNMPFENTYGHGGLLTTAEDLLRWNAALSSGRLGAFVTNGLAEQAVLTSGRKVNYARGLFWGDYKGHRVLGHPGATAGYRAWVGRFPDDGLSVVLLCNTTDADDTALVHAVADAFLPSRPVKAAAKDVSDAKGASGLFIDEVTGAPLQLSMEGGRLKLGPGQDFAPVGRDVFQAEDTLVRFAGPDRFTISDGLGTSSTFKRGAPAQAPNLADYAGIYVSDEVDATYQLDVAEGALVVSVKGRPEMIFPVAPAYADAFVLEGVLLKFYRGADGKVAGFRMTGERVRNLQFERTRS